jgi:hypothetical protein
VTFQVHVVEVWAAFRDNVFEPDSRADDSVAGQGT